MQNPFSNPFTRNRQLPSAVIVSGKAAKNLKVPQGETFEQQQARLRDLHVPQQSHVPEDPLAGFELHRDPTLAPDEWSHMRIIGRHDSSKEWGDAWGRDEIEKERRENEISRRYNAFVAMQTAKLKSDLKKDEFRKQLLKDIDDGKYFPKTRLIEEN